MNKKIYVRYDTAEGSSWASCLEGLNVYSNSEEYDVLSLKDYQQKVDYYYRFDNNKMRIFKTVSDNPKNFLSIGIPARAKDQNICIAAIDTDIIFEALSKNKYDTIYFAYKHVDGQAIREIDIMEVSKFYGRNILTGLVEDVVTGEHMIEENFSMSLWYSVSKMGDSDIYYLVVNPNLLMIVEDINGTLNNIDYKVVNSHDGNLRNSVFKPSITGGVLIGDNIIYSDGDEVTIDVFGNSALHGFKGYRLSEDELPKIDLLVESSVEYKLDRDKITLDLSGKNVCYVKYMWRTNTPLDYFLTGSEKLEYSFVIIKQ